MGSQHARVRGFAIVCLGGTVATSLACSQLASLPEHHAVPTPGGREVAVPCDSVVEQPAASPPAGRHGDALGFGVHLENWPVRTGVFASAEPIRVPAIRAGDVQADWTAHKSLLPAESAPYVGMLVPLGGDYWRDTRYFVAPRSTPGWVSSRFSARDREGILPIRGDEAETGVMTSSAFALDAAYIRVAVGGDDDANVGVELLVRPKGALDLSQCNAQGEAIALGRLQSSLLPPGFVPVFVWRGRAGARGPAKELLETVERPTKTSSCDLYGLEAMVRIVDVSTTAHVNVGTIALSDEALDPSRTEPIPLWGLADYHTHPTDYLGFGGLQGVHTIWGAPGGKMSEYVGAKGAGNLARDLPPCDDPHLQFSGHHGGLAAPAMINGAEGRLTPSLQDLMITQIADKHGEQGAPTFADFPDFRAGAHEQHHITQIHRAYLGGLRLMTALAVTNPGLEYGMGWVRCGDGGRPTVDTTNDWAVVRAHVRAMKQLAELNQDWMEIAYSPADARRIIRANRLAVVLGTEVPELGQDCEGDPEQQVTALEGMGIRQVILVHGMDNLLAGTAVFEDLYNTVSDWMHRPDRDKVETLSGLTVWHQPPESLFEIDTSPSPLPTYVPGGGPSEPTEPIAYRLSTPDRIVLSDLFPRPDPLTYSIPFVDKPFGVLHTLVNTTPLFKTPRGKYDLYRGGHRNHRDLTGRGREFAERLMVHGMLLDIAHMSDATLRTMYDVTGHACASYPLLVSHVRFRRLALKTDYSDRVDDLVTRTNAAVRADLLKGIEMSACIQGHGCDAFVFSEALKTSRQAPQLGNGTVNRENLAREFDIASSELQQIRGRRGAVGVFMGQGPIDTSVFGQDTSPSNRALPYGLDVLPITDDCAGSSKGLAAALIYANARMQGRAGIGLASDFTLVSNTVPRFGPNACAGYLGAGASSSSAAQLLETLMDPGHYDFRQSDGVTYTSGVKTCTAGGAHSISCGANVPMVPDAMGSRTYDFNVDGLAQYGLLPDLLQDVANVLHDARGFALDPVFESADSYIDMWERARRVSGCEARGTCPDPGRARDPQCLGAVEPRPECGMSCPCGWNRGAPLQEIGEVKGMCDPGRRIGFPMVGPAGQPMLTSPVYSQHAADPGQSGGDITRQGDWAVFPIGGQQTWTCGDDRPKSLGCPVGANWVKVRRTLDTTVSTFVDRCDYQPLPPEAGNRRVEFLCLVGPPATFRGIAP